MNDGGYADNGKKTWRCDSNLVTIGQLVISKASFSAVYSRSIIQKYFYQR